MYQYRLDTVTPVVGVRDGLIEKLPSPSDRYGRRWYISIYIYIDN